MIAKVISSIPREVYPLWEALRLADVGKLPKGFRSSSSVIVCPLEKQRRSRAERGSEDCPTQTQKLVRVSLRCHQLDGCGLIIDSEGEGGRRKEAAAAAQTLVARTSVVGTEMRGQGARGAGALASPLREMIVSPSDPANGDSAVSSDEDTCPPLLLRMCVGGTLSRRGEQRQRPRKRRRVGQTQLPLRKCLDE